MSRAPEAPTPRDAAMVSDLLVWGDEVRRDLPWRRTRDPWAILVSELMLQQTQVSRVEPRFNAFLDRFPTPTDCAGSAPAEVVKMWDGLGYNRRAIHLHRAAGVMVEHHDGAVPRTLAELMSLPGIGPYTARAVLAFAFDESHGVLDTNAARYLARAVAGRRLKPKEAQQLADDLVPAGRSWAYNQAVLDLGATVCVKRRPRCGACPIASSCAWNVAGRPDPDPADGTAGSSGKQAAFAGSNRQGRGRLVRALRTGPIEVQRVADVTGWPDEPERAQQVADSLVSDGLAEYVDGTIALPA